MHLNLKGLSGRDASWNTETPLNPASRINVGLGLGTSTYGGLGSTPLTEPRHGSGGALLAEFLNHLP